MHNKNTCPGAITKAQKLQATDNSKCPATVKIKKKTPTTFTQIQQATTTTRRNS